MTASVEEIPMFVDQKTPDVVENSFAVVGNAFSLALNTTETPSSKETEGWVNDGVIAFPKLEGNVVHAADSGEVTKDIVEFPLIHSAEPVHDILMDGLDMILEVINNDSANSCSPINYLDFEVNKRITEIMDELKKYAPVNTLIRPLKILEKIRSMISEQLLLMFLWDDAVYFDETISSILEKIIFTTIYWFFL